MAEGNSITTSDESESESESGSGLYSELVDAADTTSCLCTPVIDSGVRSSPSALLSASVVLVSSGSGVPNNSRSSISASVSFCSGVARFDALRAILLSSSTENSSKPDYSEDVDSATVFPSSLPAVPFMD